MERWYILKVFLGKNKEIKNKRKGGLMMREKIIPKLSYVFYKHKIFGWSKLPKNEFQRLLEKIKKGEIEEVDIELLSREEIENICQAAKEVGFNTLKDSYWRLVIITKN